MSPRYYIPHLVNGLIVTGILIGGLVAYPALPHRFPGHFNLFGIPDAYHAKSFIAWFRIALPGLGVMALLYLMGALSTLSPRLSAILCGISGEARQLLLSLPSHRQEEVLHPCRMVFYGLALMVGLITGTLQIMTFVTALDGPGFPFALLNFCWLMLGAISVLRPIIGGRAVW